MKTIFSKTQIVELCKGLKAKLTPHIDQYPGLGPVCDALVSCAANPLGETQLTTPGGMISSILGKADSRVSKPKSKGKKPVLIAYQGDEIKVHNVPWGKAYYALCRILGVVKKDKSGNVMVHKAPGKEWDGTPIYKSCYDKRSKSYSLPADKAEEVHSFFAEEGLPIQVKA